MRANSTNRRDVACKAMWSDTHPLIISIRRQYPRDGFSLKTLIAHAEGMTAQEFAMVARAGR